MAGEPQVGVWYRIRSKATGRELFAPELNAENHHVQAAGEGDGTAWRLDSLDIGYGIAAAGKYPMVLDSNGPRRDPRGHLHDGPERRRLPALGVHPHP